MGVDSKKQKLSLKKYSKFRHIVNVKEARVNINKKRSTEKNMISDVTPF